VILLPPALAPYTLLLKAGAVVAVLVAAGAGGWTLNGWRLNAQLEKAHTAVADIRAQQAERIAEAERAGRAAVESDVKRQIELAERIARDAQAAVAQVEIERVAAVAAGRGLRDAARAVAARACADPVAPVAAATGGASAPSAGDLLAELFARADARAGELAQVADARRIAGLACEAVR
jgi:hypothetical protein